MLGGLCRIWFLAAALALLFAAPAAAGDLDWRFTLEANNNLDSLADLTQLSILGLESWFETEARASWPLMLHGLEYAELRIGFGEGAAGRFGLFGRQSAWLSGPGEMALFLQNACEEGRLPAGTELYDLGGAMENYAAAGAYWETSWENGRMRTTLRGEVFACLLYQKSAGSGRGKLYQSGDGDQGVDIAGSYRILTGQGGPAGFGADLSWEMGLRLPSGFLFDLEVTNLCSLVYFPRMSIDNGLVEGEDIPVGGGGHSAPGSWITGFVSEEEYLASLPAAVRARVAWPMLGGRGSIELLGLGEVQDYRLAYAYPLGPVELSLGYDPIMQNALLGCQWQGGRAALLFGREIVGFTVSLGPGAGSPKENP